MEPGASRARVNGRSILSQHSRPRLAPQALPYLLASFFVVIPLLVARRDMWDGTLISYGMETGDHSGIRSWLFTSGWELQYWLLASERLVADVAGVSFRTVNLSLTVIAFLLLVRQTTLLARRELKLPTWWAAFAASFVAVFPVWSVLLSSVMTIHLLCLSLSLLGVRLLHSRGRVTQAVGLGLVGASFQLNSLLVFAPVLSYVLDVWTSNRRSKRWMPSPATSLALGLAVAYFAFQRAFNPPTGLYAGYNAIVNPLSSGGGRALVVNLAGYATFLALPALALLLPLAASRILRARRASGGSLVDMPSVRYYMVLILVVAAVVPYVVVGKTTSVMGFADWSGRQAFVLAPALALATAVLLRFAHVSAARSGWGSWPVACAAIWLLVAQVVIGSLGFATKLNRQAFEQDLQAAVSESLRPLPPGTLQIVGEGIPGPTFRPYEANYLVYGATRDTRHWTRIGESVDANLAPPAWIGSLGNTSRYIFASSRTKCSSVIQVTARDYTGTARSFWNALHLNQDRSVVVRDVATTCA